MNEAEFDRRFEAAFEAAGSKAGAAIAADYRPSWERLQAKLAKQRRSRNLRTRIGRLAVVVAALIAVAFAIEGPRMADAIQPVYAKIIETPSGVFSFVFGREDSRTKARTPPPPASEADGLGSGSAAAPYSRTVVADMAGAAAAVSFPSPTFGYVPAGYAFDRVYLTYAGDRERADMAAYVFKKTGEERYMTFQLARLAPNSGLADSKPADGVFVNKVRLKDTTGILTTTTGGSTRLEAIVGNVFLSFSGIMTADDVLKVYDGMKLGE